MRSRCGGSPPTWGMGTMSLYNYVPTKEHLVQLMIHEVVGRIPLPRPAPAGSPHGTGWTCPGRAGASPSITRGCPASCSGHP